MSLSYIDTIEGTPRTDYSLELEDLETFEQKVPTTLPVCQYNKWQQVENETMDTIFIMHCNEEIDDHIGDIVRVLKPGGQIIVVGGRPLPGSTFKKQLTFNDLKDGFTPLITTSDLLAPITKGQPLNYKKLMVEYFLKQKPLLYIKSEIFIPDIPKKPTIVPVPLPPPPPVPSHKKNAVRGKKKSGGKRTQKRMR
jgi:hypothetical protein